MVASPIPPSGHIPPQFLSTLVDLDTVVNKTIASEKSAAKKMAPVKAKALNGMKQTLKKKAKEFEGVLKTYNEVTRDSLVFWMSIADDIRTPLLMLLHMNLRMLFR